MGRQGDDGHIGAVEDRCPGRAQAPEAEDADEENDKKYRNGGNEALFSFHADASAARSLYGNGPHCSRGMTGEKQVDSPRSAAY
jgi:hypothetical protein